MPRLNFQNELTPSSFAELGRPAGGFQRNDGQVIALCTDFELLYWPGRALYDGHRLQHRISLYSKGFVRRLGLFDFARFPINDVAFHPLQPIVAVATGCYDGGYLFEGDLWLWNWETGEVRSLLGESREVVQCRFVDESRLAVTLRPRDEDEFEGEEICVGLILDDFRDASESGFDRSAGGADPRLANLTPLDPQSLGFATPPMHFQERRQRFERVLGVQTNYEERVRAWDVAWIADDRIALSHDNCHVEVWTLGGERELLETGEGFGVQILSGPAGPLIHALRRGNHYQGTEDRSTLYRLGQNGLEMAHAFDHAVVLSTDNKGNLLCRDPGDLLQKRERLDRVLTSDFREVFAGDLGHYDCFNHFVRLDGGDGLYFLQGTPPKSHEQKRLCRFNRDGTSASVLPWDSAELHLNDSSACWGPRGSIVRAFRVYDPLPCQGAKQIQRCDLATGEALWSTATSALVTSMVMIGQKYLAYALTDGELGLLSIDDGSVLFRVALEIEGAPSVATALAVNGLRLAIGTIDARLLVYELEP